MIQQCVIVTDIYLLVTFLFLVGLFFCCCFYAYCFFAEGTEGQGEEQSKHLNFTLVYRNQTIVLHHHTNLQTMIQHIRIETCSTVMHILL